MKSKKRNTATTTPSHTHTQKSMALRELNVKRMSFVYDYTVLRVHAIA